MSELLKNSNGVASSSQIDLVLQDVHVCDICAGAGREDTLAICSGCSDGAEHIYCMRERMDRVPSGDWRCEECQNGAQREGRKAVDIEAIAKLNSFEQANSGSNGRNKRSLPKLIDNENRVGSSTAKILGKRKLKGGEVFQDMLGDGEANSGSEGRNMQSLAKLSDCENRVANVSTVKILGKRPSEDVEAFQDKQGDSGISAGSIGCPASQTRTPESSSLSSGGRVRHMGEKGPQRNCIPDLNSPIRRSSDMQGDGGVSAGVQHLGEKGPRESQRNFIPDLNSLLVGDDDFTFSVAPPKEVKRSDDCAPPKEVMSQVVAGTVTFSGGWQFFPAAGEEVQRGGGSSAAIQGGQEEELLSFSLALPSQTATEGREDEQLSLSLSLPIPDAGTSHRPF